MGRALRVYTLLAPPQPAAPRPSPPSNTPPRSAGGVAQSWRGTTASQPGSACETSIRRLFVGTVDRRRTATQRHPHLFLAESLSGAEYSGTNKTLTYLRMGVPAETLCRWGWAKVRPAD